MPHQPALEALARFLAKIEALIADPDAGLPSLTGTEEAWLRVLRAAHREFCHSHTLADSYRISSSALAGVLIEGGDTDYDSLLSACKREHTGRFPRQRRFSP